MGNDIAVKGKKSHLMAKVGHCFYWILCLGFNDNATHAQADRIVRTMFDTITEHLASGGRVELRGFGSFDLKKRKSRTGRNPRTGEAVAVEEKSAIYFRTGKELRDRLNADKD